PPLPDRGGGLHRRPAPLGIPGRAAGRGLRHPPPGCVGPAFAPARDRRHPLRGRPQRPGLMSFLERYERALREEARVPDPAQRAVAGRLDALDRCLTATPPPAAWRWRLQSILGRRQEYPQACRGIYLWGGVGRGKTWLMDLFAAGRGG